MAVTDRVRELVLPLLADRQLDLYDVELAGSLLKVVVDRPEGLDLDLLSDATRAVSRALDEADPIPGTYTLEVTSPGLERTLRTPQHFARAVGERVKVKLHAGADAAAAGERRLAGELVAADVGGITVRTGDDDGAPAERRVAYDDIDRARTVFEWGPTAKPGAARRPGRKSQRKRAGKATSDEKRDHTS
ncbi:MAG TPA: ribosome maturation factor RimP [Acidimicrobiales bacterium]